MMPAGSEAERIGVPPPEEQARADNYRLLARLLAGPPDSGTLATLRAIEAGNGPMAPLWGELRQAAQETDSLRVEDEYNRLFIGLGRGEVLPYASWYLTGFLMEKPLAELRSVLARLGFVRQGGVAEPEDHAAALCEVMGLIISADELNLEQSRVFFDSFLGSWLQRFFQDLEAAESAAFYRAVARLGQRVMEIEQEYFSMPA
jgi:TorA maturation chaperone TorD